VERLVRAMGLERGGERVERLGGEVGEGDGTGTKTQIVCN
jgi:hypothetical protein